MTGTTLTLVDKLTSNSLSYLSAFNNCSGYTTLATDKSYPCILELTGATMNGTKINQRYIVAGLHESSMADISASAQQMISNAIYYILNKDIPTGIDDVEATSVAVPVAIYSLGGMKQQTLKRGANIVKMSDGKIKTIIYE